MRPPPPTLPPFRGLGGIVESGRSFTSSAAKRRPLTTVKEDLLSGDGREPGNVRGHEQSSIPPRSGQTFGGALLQRFADGRIAGRRDKVRQSFVEGRDHHSGIITFPILRFRIPKYAQRFHRRLRNILHDNISNLSPAKRVDVVCHPRTRCCRTLIQRLP